MSKITDHGFTILSCEQIEELIKECGFSNAHSEVFEDDKKVEFPSVGTVCLNTGFIIGAEIS